MVDFFLGLAASVVKATVRIWQGDSSVAGDVTDSVVDLVKAKVSGELDQRRAIRFFEDLEVPVAQRLHDLRKAEFRSLPENERNAAILAVGESFDSARLNARDLSVHDLDPLLLERSIRKDRDRATRDLSGDGTAFYDRLVTECCTYVMEIADKLPHFEAGVFAELLARNRQILDRIDEVLERIPKWAEGSPHEARFVTACRRRIATKLDHLQVFGLDFEAQPYTLSVAYVSLRTDSQSSTVPLGVEEWLAAHSRALLVGRAGSGKTTVLQWLAVRACRADFIGALSKLNGCFPFFVRLRDYVGNSLPQPEQFLACTAPLLVPETPDGWVRAQLDSGRALVLVDGLDEIPPAERHKASEWLRDLIERFGAARFVITGRPMAVPEGWLADSGLVRSSLETMEPSMVRMFVSNWHEALRMQMPDNDERAQVDYDEQSLLAIISADRYLRDLADTPLLAALLCALNRHMRSNLPRRRAEIYERALSMFDQRDRARGIAPSSVSLDLTAKTHILADLALWMVRNGESEVSASDAVGEVSRSITGLPDVGWQPDSVLRVLLERSTVLREPASGRIDFVHRTFQEFLAAKAAVDGNGIGELVRNVSDDQWAEVMVLAAGQANHAQSGQLLQSLLESGQDSQHRRRILAIACLDAVRSVDATVRTKAETVIPDLLPPRSMEQAEQLSKAGEPLIPPLARNWTRDTRKAPETIRAAALVGGISALELVRDIATRCADTPGVTEEIRRGWQYFDTDEYARVVLTAARVKKFDIDDPAYLQALSNVPSIEDLSILIRTEGIRDLSILRAYPELTHLRIRDAHASYRELAGLAGCHKLSSLTLSGEIRRLPPLPYLKNLTQLAITNNQSLQTLAGLEPHNITKVILSGLPGLRDISQLNELENLREIVIRDSGRVDLSGIAAIPGLSLQLEQCGEVDVTPLAASDLFLYHDQGTVLRNAKALTRRGIVRRI